jgi:histidinol-phosphatase
MRRFGYIPRITSDPAPSQDPEPPPSLADDLSLALGLADVADAVTMPRFRARDLLVETKTDLTPVTEADRAAEQALRDALRARRPGDGVLGEEGGEAAGSAVGGGGEVRRRWVLDPIDGTKSYARGIPVWATLVALEHDGVPVVGVVSAPALGARWWAARGMGAFRDGEAIRVSRVTSLDDAHLSYDSVAAFDAAGMTEQFLALVRRCRRSRAFGDFWSHVLVADGSIDVAIEVGGLAAWDVAAPMVVVQEAGGRLTDVTGTVRTDGGTAVATNGLLHDAVLDALGARAR